MGAIPEKILRLFRRPMIYVVWGSVSALLTVMGPFGTLSAMHWPQRGAYWFVIVGLVLILSPVIGELAALFEPDRRSWRHDLLRIVGIVAIFSPLGWLWTIWIPDNGLLEKPSFWGFALMVVLVSVVIRVGHRVIRGDEAPFAAQEDGAMTLEAEAPATEPEIPRIFRRLPDGVQGPVLRLSASDHLVEVVLRTEVHSLRMRFTDAIDEMDGVEGYCTHRSHWVVRAAISAVERDGPKIFLRLENGDQIPVSRTYKPGLEDAGIL